MIVDRTCDGNIGEVPFADRTQTTLALTLTFAAAAVVFWRLGRHRCRRQWSTAVGLVIVLTDVGRYSAVVMDSSADGGDGSWYRDGRRWTRTSGAATGDVGRVGGSGGEMLGVVAAERSLKVSLDVLVALNRHN
jgi:hypothetical protein